MNQENKFYIDEKRVGNNYGIQVNFEQLQDAVNVIIKVCNYSDFPLTSHLGTTFNMCKLKDICFDITMSNNLMLFVFKRKYWTTELKNCITSIYNKDIERTFTIKEKKVLCDMFKFLNMKIVKKWNCDCNSNSVSILIKKTPIFIDKTKQPKKYKKTLTKFLKVCNDLAEIKVN